MLASTLTEGVGNETASTYVEVTHAWTAYTIHSSFRPVRCNPRSYPPPLAVTLGCVRTRIDSVRVSLCM